MDRETWVEKKKKRHLFTKNPHIFSIRCDRYGVVLITDEKSQKQDPGRNFEKYFKNIVPPVGINIEKMYNASSRHSASD